MYLEKTNNTISESMIILAYQDTLRKWLGCIKAGRMTDAYIYENQILVLDQTFPNYVENYLNKKGY